MANYTDSFEALEELIRKNSTDAGDLNKLDSLINKVKTANRINDKLVSFEFKIVETSKNFRFFPSIDEGTLLHLAASIGNVNAVSLLLRAGANVSLKAKEDLDVLHVAVWNGHTAIVKALLSEEVVVDAKDQVHLSLAIDRYLFIV